MGYYNKDEKDTMWGKQHGDTERLFRNEAEQSQVFRFGLNTSHTLTCTHISKTNPHVGKHTDIVSPPHKQTSQFSTLSPASIA